jgi:MarR family transcriptional regulator for hemolysin
VIVTLYIIAMLTDPTLIPYLLNDLSRHIRYAFDARARTLGVTRPQYRLLLTIARQPGQTQSELADVLDVERITLGRMIDRMATAGLLQRRADPNDRRVWRMHMLPLADTLIAQLRAIGEEVTTEAFSHLEPDERDTLHNLLLKLDQGLRQTRQAKQKAVA